MAAIVAINYFAVLAAGIASMVLGMIWYSPALFGNKWIKLIGMKIPKNPKEMKAMQQKAMPSYVGMFIGSLITAWVLSMFVDFTGAVDYLNGAMTGAWIWLGFVATTQMSGVLFGGQPKELFYINAGFHLVNLAVMGAILATWL